MKRAFTFFFHDGAHTIPSFDIEILETTEEARARALELLRKRPKYEAVEIADLLGAPLRVTRQDLEERGGP